MECPKCGHHCKEDQKFCNKCGTKIHIPSPRRDDNSLPATDYRTTPRSVKFNITPGQAILLVSIVAIPILLAALFLKKEQPQTIQNIIPSTAISPISVPALPQDTRNSNNIASVPRYNAQPAIPYSNPQPPTPQTAIPNTQRPTPSTPPQNSLPSDSKVYPDHNALYGYLGENELKKLSNEQLCWLRNEYFVRRGMTFSEKTHPHLKNYYERQEWYHQRPVMGRSAAEAEAMWNEMKDNEQYNIRLIKRIEESRLSWHTEHRGPQPPEEYPAGS